MGIFSQNTLKILKNDRFGSYFYTLAELLEVILKPSNKITGSYYPCFTVYLDHHQVHHTVMHLVQHIGKLN